MLVAGDLICIAKKHTLYASDATLGQMTAIQMSSLLLLARTGTPYAGPCVHGVPPILQPNKHTVQSIGIEAIFNVLKSR